MQGRTIRTGLLFGVLALGTFLLFGGCASKHPKTEPPPQTAHVAQPTPATPSPNPQVTPLAASDPVIEAATTNASGAFERKDLDVYDKVTINVAYAEITVHAAHPARRGHLHIEKLQGDGACKLYVDETEDQLTISDRATLVPPRSHGSFPSRPNCHFVIELELHESGALNVHLSRGAVFVENWKDPIQIRMEWGDVDVGAIGSLDVACGHCTVAGEGVSGSLHYALDSGNVGLAGLSSTVEGQTLGDTILKWRKVKPDTEVKLTSHAGDVILFFPAGVSINTDLKVPHGEIDARLNSGSRGVPVSIVAEAGNVKLYRSK